MNKQLCLFSFLVGMATFTTAFDERSFFDETNNDAKWEFVEKKFITDIADSKQFVWQHITPWILGSIASVAAWQSYQTSIKENNTDFVKSMLQTSNVYFITSTAAATILATQGFQCFLSNYANRQAIEEFFVNWDENATYTPKELTEAFDMIAETLELQGKEAVLEHADEIVDMIQFVTMRHFKDRYKNILEYKASNALADTKTLGEIIKISLESADKLKGK